MLAEGSGRRVYNARFRMNLGVGLLLEDTTSYVNDSSTWSGPQSVSVGSSFLGSYTVVGVVAVVVAAA